MSQEKVNILGYDFDNMTPETARSRLLEAMMSNGNSRIFTPNPEILYRAYRSAEFSEILRSADILLPDGIGVIIASRLLRSRIHCRISGIDAAEWILELAADSPDSPSVFLLGGAEGIADSAAEEIKKRFPALNISGTHHGYFNKSSSSAENQSVLKKIQKASPTILFVCLGSPAQEKWIVENTPYLPSLRLSIGLGGALDVWSGKLKRAPVPLRKMGIEWLWRALCQPSRFIRLRFIPAFFCAVIKECPISRFRRSSPDQ